MAKNTRRIVVLGGGFAGIECTKKLESYFSNDDEIEIVLISEDNFILFTPMLPQVASGMVDARDIITPVRSVFKKVTFYEDRVRSIDPYGKIVNLRRADRKHGIGIRYDFLVIALGSKTNFFDMKDIKKHAHTMKTLNDAIMLRNKTMDMLEQSEIENDPIRRKGMLTFVIVGGGFAGIETAGELMDLILDARKYYPHIWKSDINVMVVNAGPVIIPGFDKKMAKFAYDEIVKRGIEIRLNSRVVAFNGVEATIQKIGSGGEGKEEEDEGETVRTNTLVWTTGVAQTDAIKNSVFKVTKEKLVVNKFLELPGFPGIFAIGDCTSLVDPRTNLPYPATVQIAEAQAKIAAVNVRALIRNKEKTEFDFIVKGHRAIIGKRAGIATFMGKNIVGFWAWFLWRNIYLSKIAKPDKKFRVLLNWSIDLFFDRDISRMDVIKKTDDRGYRETGEQDIR